MEYVKYAPEQNVEVHVTEMGRETFTKSVSTKRRLQTAHMTTAHVIFVTSYSVSTEYR